MVLHATIALTQLDLEQVELTTTLEASLANNPQPIQFDLEADVTGESSITLEGDLDGTWNDPFGLSWMSLKNVDTQLVFQSGNSLFIYFTILNKLIFLINIVN